MNFCSGKNVPQEYEPQSERESYQAKQWYGSINTNELLLIVAKCKIKKFQGKESTEKVRIFKLEHHVTDAADMKSFDVRRAMLNFKYLAKLKNDLWLKILYNTSFRLPKL